MKHFPIILFMTIGLASGFTSCAGDKGDASRPTADSGPKSLSERLSETNGYTQDAEGNWKVKSDKRSEYDSNRESAYFSGKIEKSTYKTGDYKKKSWWGTKEYGKKEYAGNTDGSRFMTKARQDGQQAGANGQEAKLTGPFKTNTLARESARESGFSAIDRPSDAAVDATRGTYKAPSVIDWREQRDMSVEGSRGILGR